MATVMPTSLRPHSPQVGTTLSQHVLDIAIISWRKESSAEERCMCAGAGSGANGTDEHGVGESGWMWRDVKERAKQASSHDHCGSVVHETLDRGPTS